MRNLHPMARRAVIRRLTLYEVLFSYIKHYSSWPWNGRNNSFVYILTGAWLYFREVSISCGVIAALLVVMLSGTPCSVSSERVGTSYVRQTKLRSFRTTFYIQKCFSSLAVWSSSPLQVHCSGAEIWLGRKRQALCGRFLWVCSALAGGRAVRLARCLVLTPFWV